MTVTGIEELSGVLPALVTPLHRDGSADDSEAIQQAINKVEETHHQGILFIPEGRYRINKTIYVWPGIRLIGYGAKRPVFFVTPNSSAFQNGPSYMVFFTGGRPAAFRSGVKTDEKSTDAPGREQTVKANCLRAGLRVAAAAILAAVTAALRKPILLVIRARHPGEVRPRRSRLLAPRPLWPTTALLLRRGRLSRLAVHRRRHGGVAGVTGEQMLQFGQLRRQLLVGLHQVRDLRGQRRDLPILTPRNNDQLVARHLLRLGHAKIKLRPDRRLRDQHATINRLDPPSEPSVMRRVQPPFESPQRPERPR